jgi:hypothetical protein
VHTKLNFPTRSNKSFLEIYSQVISEIDNKKKKIPRTIESDTDRSDFFVFGLFFLVMAGIMFWFFFRQ